MKQTELEMKLALADNMVSAWELLLGSVFSVETLKEYDRLKSQRENLIEKLLERKNKHEQ